MRQAAKLADGAPSGENLPEYSHVKGADGRPSSAYRSQPSLQQSSLPYKIFGGKRDPNLMMACRLVSREKKGEGRERGREARG